MMIFSTFSLLLLHLILVIVGQCEGNGVWSKVCLTVSRSFRFLSNLEEDNSYNRYSVTDESWKYFSSKLVHRYVGIADRFAEKTIKRLNNTSIHFKYLCWTHYLTLGCSKRQKNELCSTEEYSKDAYRSIDRAAVLLYAIYEKRIKYSGDDENVEVLQELNYIWRYCSFFEFLLFTNEKKTNKILKEITELKAHANSYLDAAARYYVRKFYNRCYNSINGNELSEDDGQISEAKPRKKLIKKRRDNVS